MAVPAMSRVADEDRPEPGWDSQFVRHLLFNPLSVVRGAAQTLLARELDPALRAQLLEAIVTSSADIERVLLDLLDPSSTTTVWQASRLHRVDPPHGVARDGGRRGDGVPVHRDVSLLDPK